MLEAQSLAEERFMELGARPRKRRVLLGWCWECGEKTQAGNSRTMLKRESESLGGEGA